MRSFRVGDEIRLVELWNVACADFGGFVPRTPEHWRWSILQRPGVSAADVVVIEDRSGVARGYGVLGSDGTVLEVAVDPRIGSRRRRDVASLLVDGLQDRALGAGAETLRFHLPAADRDIVWALEKLGFLATRYELLQLALIDVEGFLQKLLAERRSQLESLEERDFILRLSPGRYRLCPHPELSIRLDEPTMVTAEGTAPAAACSIALDLSTLTEVIVGQREVREAHRSGEISVEPHSSLNSGLGLLRALALRSSAFTPQADVR